MDTENRSTLARFARAVWSLENGRKPLERRAVALVSALALEQIEGKAATRAVLEALAASKKRPKSVRFDVSAAAR